MAVIYTAAQAQLIAEELSTRDIHGWTYSVSIIGDPAMGKAHISVFNKAGEFIDYLDIHLVAEYQERTGGVEIQHAQLTRRKNKKAAND